MGFWGDAWDYVKDAATMGPARRLVQHGSEAVRTGGDPDAGSKFGWQAANMGETPFGNWVETKATGRGDGKWWLSGPGDEGDVTGAEHAQAMQDAWRKAAERYRQIGGEAASRYDAAKGGALAHYAPAQGVFEELYGGGSRQVPQPPTAAPQPSPRPAPRGSGFRRSQWR